MKHKRFIGSVIFYVAVIFGQWIFWQWRPPTGCPDFARYYINECSRSAMIPGTLYLIASGGVMILVEMAVRNALRRRRGRGEDSTRSRVS